MKYSKTQIFSRVHKIPELCFEDQRLTSFAGLVIIQELFAKLQIKDRLRACFDHMPKSAVFGHHMIVLILIVHLLPGYRRLRDIDYYRDDLMVLRLPGLRKLPDVSTVSRVLACVDSKSILKIRLAWRHTIAHDECQSDSPKGWFCIILITSTTLPDLNSYATLGVTLSNSQ